MQSTLTPLPGAENMLHVVQQNQQRRLLIRDVGVGVSNLLNIPAAELLDQEVSKIFPHRILQDLADDVTYDLQGEDIAEVLRKIRRITLLNAKGEEMPVQLRIYPQGVEGIDTVYALSITSEAAALSRTQPRPVALALRQKTHANVMHDGLGIADRITLLADLEIVHTAIHTQKAVAVLGIAIVDMAFPKTLLRSITQTLGQSLRTDDVLGYYGEHMFGFILVDTPKENAPIALHRLRMALGDGHSAQAPITILYDEISGSESVDALTKRLDKLIEKTAPTQGVMIVDARA